MRITIKPPSPTPPALAPGALLTVRVETADPAALLSGPPTIAYEGRYTTDPAPAFLFPAPGNDNGAPGVSTATSAASDFRTPFATPLQPHVDVPVHEGDTITATLITPPPSGKTYSAALRAPAPHPPSSPPAVLQLVEGGAAPPQPPTPQPAPGLTITPDPGDPDVLNLDPAPGNDNIVVEN
jgi:vegetative cell wall protein gp1|nr:MAG TPA: hypothetical protein [Caudoviricetes sp.]